MKRLFLSFITVVSLVVLASCVYILPNMGKGSVETLSKQTTFNVQPNGHFDAILAQQAIQVKYTQGGKPGIKVTTNLKDTELLDIRVKEETLIVGYKPTVTRIDENVKTLVEITGYNVNEFKTTSSADLVVNAPYTAHGELELDATSGSSIAVSQFKADEVSADATSAATIILEWGTVRKFDGDATSGASIHVAKLTADKVSAEASSGADIRLNGTAKRIEYKASSGASIKAKELVAETGEAHASSGSSIHANAKHLNQRSSSGGEVTVTQR